MYNKDLELLNVEVFSDGRIRSGFPKKEYCFDTEYGKFKAQYNNVGERKQTINSLEFFEDGNIRKISLEEQVKISTSYGEIPVELILFYNTKKIRKIFPLNGRITGYWSEKDEYKLAKELEFDIGEVKIKGKFINIEFYENGFLKSLLLWPNEEINIEIDNKKIKVKNKISFYKNGNIKSIEPSGSIMVNTPIGEINVVNDFSSGFGYDSTILFSEKGEIKKIKTASEKFQIIKGLEIVKFIEPKFNPSMCNDKILLPETIKIEFEKNYIRFDGIKFEKSKHKFLIYNNAVKKSNISYCS